jgi:S-phase kinase-associated protein 1
MTQLTVIKLPYKDVDLINNVIIEPIDKKAFSDINLPESDGNAFVICRDHLKLSKFLDDLIEDVKYKNVPVSLKIDGKILTLILMYMSYHNNIKSRKIDKPIKDTLKNILDEWDYNFIFSHLIKNGVECKLLSEMLHYANYLEIDTLEELCAASFASLIKNKSPEEIRKIFNIANDFTPEEEEKIKKENYWSDE